MASIFVRRGRIVVEGQAASGNLRPIPAGLRLDLTGACAEPPAFLHKWQQAADRIAVRCGRGIT